MPGRPRYLIVDGHSIIFAWPKLLKMHSRRTALAREALIKELQNYQDWTGVRTVAVFDGKGSRNTSESRPTEIQIFYSGGGQSADSIIERLACKYAGRYDFTVATADSMIRETASACGALSISPDGLRRLLDETGNQR